MRAPGDRGMVLVAVLLAVAIMSVAVVAITALTRAGIASTRLEQRLLDSHFALRSGLEAAKAAIVATPVEERVFLDGTPFTIEVGNGIAAEVTIRDAAGLADLNRSDLALIEAVISERLDPEPAQKLVARIAELRQAAAKQDGTTTPPAGQQPAAEKPQPPPPVVFRSADQLPPLAEDPDAVVKALSGLLTVFSPRGLVNPLSAPDEVLSAVPGITPGDIAAIDGARKIRAWKANQGVVQIVERLKPFLAVEEPKVFIISVRLSGGPGILPESAASAVVLLNEEGPLPFRTLFVAGL